MNAWLPMLILAAICGAGGCGFWYGTGVGKDRVTACAARDDQVAQQTREAAAKGTAEAIAQIKPINKTIVQRAEKDIYENTVYRDCRVPAAGVQLANEATTGVRPDTAGDRKLSGSGPTE